MGILGSTSSSVFMVGAGGPVGSRLPPMAKMENIVSPVRANTLATIFIVCFLVLMVLAFQ